MCTTSSSFVFTFPIASPRGTFIKWMAIVFLRGQNFWLPAGSIQTWSCCPRCYFRPHLSGLGHIVNSNLLCSCDIGSVLIIPFIFGIVKVIKNPQFCCRFDCHPHLNEPECGPEWKHIPLHAEDGIFSSPPLSNCTLFSCFSSILVLIKFQHIFPLPRCCVLFFKFC